MEQKKKIQKRVINDFQNYIFGVLEQSSPNRKYSKHDVMEICFNATKYLDLETWRFSKKFRDSLK